MNLYQKLKKLIKKIMANFLKQGKRKEYLDKYGKKNKLTKKHITEFYKILNQLEEYAKIYYKEHGNKKDLEFIKEQSRKHFGRDLDKTELTVLESKLYTLRVSNGEKD